MEVNIENDMMREKDMVESERDIYIYIYIYIERYI